MEALGFKHVLSDSGVFVHFSTDKILVIAIVYVDDTIFMGPNLSLVNKLKSVFMQRWEYYDTRELKEFLCIHITRKGDQVIVNQTCYLDKVLKRFNIDTVQHTVTPLPMGYQLLPNKSPVNKVIYNKFQQVIDSREYCR